MSYIDYIPILTTNPVVNAIILTFIPGIFYILAAYGSLFVAGASLATSIVMSIMFAALEYIVRVPIIKYSSHEAGMSNGTMQLVWIAVTFILSKISDLWMPIKSLK